MVVWSMAALWLWRLTNQGVPGVLLLRLTNQGGWADQAGCSQIVALITRQRALQEEKIMATVLAVRKTAVSPAIPFCFFKNIEPW